MDPHLGLQGCGRALPHPRRGPRCGCLATQYSRSIYQAGEYAGRAVIVLPAALTDPRPSSAGALGPPSPAPRERVPSGARRVRVRATPHHHGVNKPKILSKKPPPERGGAAASTPAGGSGVLLGSGRTGIAWVAVSMKRRQVCA